MKVSVVIVNYNVRYFLEQCLYSVQNALKNIAGEIIVVDNNSVDGSVALVKEKFTQVTMLENKKNTGFSAANNQGIAVSKGEYILLLNPDTVIQEDTLEKVIDFMDKHPLAGGLGVKMVDGKGNFLPESKRSLPTPSVAFYKIFGLARLFPKSKKFGAYHLTYLDKNDIHEVDVLSGAFMFLRKSALEKCGVLDESFFMYGEDIDLSYRLQLAGYKNYYFPETTIIHYKGESTKKSSVNYVFVFYGAMKIFARKHFSKNNASLFIVLINLAIYLRAGASVMKRFFVNSLLPLMDFGLILLSLYLIRYFYETKVRFVDGGAYDESLINIAFPVYALFWIVGIYLNGGYDKSARLKNILRGILLGTISILLVYSLLPENYRFSRAIILFGTITTFICLVFIRGFLHLFHVKDFTIFGKKTKRIGIIGTKTEFNRVNNLLKQTSSNAEFTGFISADSNGQTQENFLGHLHQLDEVIKVHQLDEVIFCAHDLSSAEIIGYMLKLVSSGVDFKIAPPESFSIIGSNSIDTAGDDLYTIDFNSVLKPENKRNKRVLDLLTCLLFLMLLFLFIWRVRHKSGFVINIFLVLFGKMSWVGYGGKQNNNLPKLKTGVLSPDLLLSPDKLSEQEINRVNLNYSKNYKVESDIKIIYMGFSSLGSR
jgi:O-antigen biosynthesis protein